ncbi:MAG: NUDIX domain-containing protein [Planctomycetota bacterium]
MTRKQKRAAGLLIFAKATRQFLLMRHRDRWDLPKGHSEPGETDTETAFRETEEETGISAGDIVMDQEFRYELKYPVRYKRFDGEIFEKTVVYFLGEIEHVVAPVLTEHESFKWFDWSPPHQIQEQTIDPLLHAVQDHWDLEERGSDARGR